MHQTLHEFRISTRGRGFYEFTQEVAGWISKRGHFGIVAHPGKC